MTLRIDLFSHHLSYVYIYEFLNSSSLANVYIPSSPKNDMCTTNLKRLIDIYVMAFANYKVDTVYYFGKLTQVVLPGDR